MNDVSLNDVKLNDFYVNYPLRIIPFKEFIVNFANINFPILNTYCTYFGQGKYYFKTVLKLFGEYNIIHTVRLS